jgi:hypothetical protein
MSETADKIEDLQKRLTELESENLRIYNQCKTIVGWPVCGERPKTPSVFTDQEFERDAVETLEKWVAFVESMNSTYKVVQKSVQKKFQLYKGEEKVAEEQVITGKPKEAAIESGRVLDL